MAVKFGTNQISNPTPTKLSRGVLIFTVVASVVVAWIPTASFITAASGTVVQSILGLIVALINALKPFFGVQVEAGIIPTENVTEAQDIKEVTDQK